MKTEIKIAKMKIDDIIPADYNPRRDLSDQDPEYHRIRKSISDFGLVEPIVWNKKTGRLVGGHQRLKVLKELGYTDVDVSVVNVSEAREKALNLVLNKAQGSWDTLKLEEVIKSIQGKDDVELTSTGFSQVELDAIMNTATDFAFDPATQLDGELAPPALVSNRGEANLPGKSFVVFLSFITKEAGEETMKLMGVDDNKFKGLTRYVNGDEVLHYLRDLYAPTELDDDGK